MWRSVVGGCAMLCLYGCASIFGLEPPRRETSGDDSGVGDDSRGSDALSDGNLDGLASNCPMNYTTVVATSSRYRIISSLATVSVHYADCANDLAGSTHLAAIQGIIELSALGSLVANSPERLWVGGVQEDTEPAPDSAWWMLTGQTFNQMLWQPGEPDDSDGVENNEENFTFLDPQTGFLSDKAGATPYYAICECDGMAIDANLAQEYVP